MVEQPLLWFFGGMAGLFAMILLHVPIGVAMAVTGVVGVGLIIGFGPALSLLAVEPASTLVSGDLATIPLFLLMGTLAAASGVASDIYRVASAFTGHRAGGLAMATVAGSAGFGAICGSSLATTATMAKVALPEMEGRGYARSLSAGSIAAGGSLGILIPPSIVMVIYAVLTEQFVLDLFVAGIGPGLLAVAIYVVTIMFVVRRNPAVAPRGPRMGWLERLAALRHAWRAATIIGLVTVGIYSGIFTVMEAASIGVAVTFAFWLASPGRSIRKLVGILVETASTGGLILLMVIGAHILSYFITLTNAPNVLVQAIGESGLSPTLIILGLLVMYIALGAVFDAVASMVLTLPFVFPLVLNLGYDPIWWGIVNVMIIEIALITPPLGLNVFIMNGVAPSYSLRVIYRGIMPFLAADIVRILLVIAFPGIVLFLPELLR